MKVSKESQIQWVVSSGSTDLGYPCDLRFWHDYRGYQFGGKHPPWQTSGLITVHYEISQTGVSLLAAKPVWVDQPASNTMPIQVM